MPSEEIDEPFQAKEPKRKKYVETDEVSISNKYLRMAIYEAFGGRCFYSGREVAFGDMHIDHIYPRAAGGKDLIANYVLTCQEINFKKGRRHDVEFVATATNFVRLVYAPKVLKILNRLTRRDANVEAAP